MKIIEFHAYTATGNTWEEAKNSKYWEETTFTAENQLSEEEMLSRFADRMMYKYINKLPMFNFPVKTSIDPSTGYRTITFLCKLCDTVAAKEVYTVGA